MSDTAWLAFQQLSIEEWKQYLLYRKQQGFNSIQISILPIAHDDNSSPNDIQPFHLKNGVYNFRDINSKYFDKAEKMLAIMQKYEMIPFLHLF